MCAGVLHPLAGVFAHGAAVSKVTHDVSDLLMQDNKHRTEEKYSKVQRNA